MIIIKEKCPRCKGNLMEADEWFEFSFIKALRCLQCGDRTYPVFVADQMSDKRQAVCDAAIVVKKEQMGTCAVYGCNTPVNKSNNKAMKCNNCRTLIAAYLKSDKKPNLRKQKRRLIQGKNGQWRVNTESRAAQATQ